MRRARMLEFTLLAGALIAVVTAGAFAANVPTVSLQLFQGAAVDRPLGITAGPDGAIWFANEDSRSIGRIAADGELTSFTDSQISSPTAITQGPDGALWFVNGAGSIGRITVTGSVTTFAAPGIGTPVDLTTGSDGALWFTTGGKSIGRMTTSGVLTLFADPARMRGTYGIAAGPDGALWFTNYLGSSIGRISVEGTVTNYTDPTIRYPTGITAGPDGALWFADDSGSIGRITTGGVVSSFGDSSTVGHPHAIVTGPDGALWATDRGGSIVRITIGGVISRYTDPKVQFPVGIAAAGGALWFTDYTANAVGRVTILPPEPAPHVTVGRPRVVATSVTHGVTLTMVRVPVHIDRGASLTLTVRNPRTGLDLRLQPGSRLASTTLKRPTLAVRASSSRAGTFVVVAALARQALTQGREYVLILDAFSPTGKRSEARVAFRA